MRYRYDNICHLYSVRIFLIDWYNSIKENRIYIFDFAKLVAWQSGLTTYRIQLDQFIEYICINLL